MDPEYRTILIRRMISELEEWGLSYNPAKSTANKRNIRRQLLYCLRRKISLAIDLGGIDG